MKIEQAAYLSRVYHTICRAWRAPEHQAEVFARVILEGDLVGRADSRY